MCISRTPPATPQPQSPPQAVLGIPLPKRLRRRPLAAAAGSARRWGNQIRRRFVEAMPSKPRTLLLCLALLLVSSPARADPCEIADQPAEQRLRLQLQDHPNHYILLIDASGSVVAKRPKARNFRQALDETVDHLFDQGFGADIPAFVPGEDLLTLHHFGVVPHEAATLQEAYRRLQDYVLPESLIHPQFVRRRAISREELAERIRPQTYYFLTVLLWAKALALDASRPPAGDDPKANRTFLIVVHDAEPNDGTLQGELNLIDIWGDAAGVVQSREKIVEIGKNYDLSDVGASGRPLWRSVVKVEEDTPPVFIEAYEVRSREQTSWQQRLAVTEPFAGLELGWTRESGDQPEGRLRLAFASGFLAQLTGDPEPTGSVALTGEGIEGKAPWVAVPELELPVQHAGPLACMPKQVTAVLNLTLTRDDALLGTRTLYYSARQTLSTPVPFHCGIPYLLLRLFLVLLVLLTAGTVAYLLFYRVVATHMTIKVPGLMHPVRLRWNETLEHGCSLITDPGVRLLRLHLPNRFLQVVLYRGVLARLSSDAPSALHWDGEQGADPIQLPVKDRRLAVIIGAESTAPEWIVLELSRKGQAARLRVGRFPGAEISEGVTIDE